MFSLILDPELCIWIWRIQYFSSKLCGFFSGIVNSEVIYGGDYPCHIRWKDLIHSESCFVLTLSVRIFRYEEVIWGDR